MSERITDKDIDLVFVGHQDISPVIEYRVPLKAIMASNSKMNCIDSFLLGVMAGKRIERAKRKSKHNTTIEREV